MATEDLRSIQVEVLKVSQPMGDFFIASMKHTDLTNITKFDVRRVLIKDRDVERYLGIQRPLVQGRLKNLEIYVNTADACFPTGVIIAIDSKCIEYDDEEKRLTIKNYIDEEDEGNNILFRNIARVLDGQHRLAGLDGFEGETFEINVSIFVGADIADQANIFATVNLEQSKVNKSLAYDLYEVMTTRSPQKTCHEIAVTLDNQENSPFYHMIKRLGVASPTREKGEETLSQATFIEPILKLISVNPLLDRKIFLDNKIPAKVDDKLLKRHPFQHLFADERDFDITDIIWNFFSAVKTKWPTAWDTRETGNIVNRTNGYRALIRFLRKTYLEIDQPVPSADDFSAYFEPVALTDAEINSERYLPGSSGESTFYLELLEFNDLD